MSVPTTTTDRAWERGWDGHARAQLLRLARLSLPEKLAWLEQAHRVIRHLSASFADGSAAQQRLEAKQKEPRQRRSS